MQIALGALLLGGTAMQVVGNLKQANAAADAADFNANQAVENAKQTDIATEENVRQTAFRGAQTIGSIRAAYGASGLSLDSGSPQTYQMDQEATLQKDILNTRYNGMLQAKNYRMQADQYKNQAEADRTAGIFGAVGAGLSGLTNAADKFGAFMPGNNLKGKSTGMNTSSPKLVRTK